MKTFFIIAAVLFCAEANLLPLRFTGATQSSTGFGGVAGRAIDGKTSGHYFKGRSCQHSASNKGLNSWTGTLATTSVVSRVVIYNRADCCQNRINGAKVFVGTTYCGAIKYNPKISVYTVQCRNAIGRTVKVVQSNQHLTLCEVKAYGGAITSLTAPLKFTGATQSSTGFGGVAGRAIDGKTSGHYFKGRSCQHSASNKGLNSWTGTLATTSVVNRVVIYNRSDCCQNRINGAKVYVDSKYCGSVRYNPKISVYTVYCRNAVGRTVKVVQANQHLTLCEVKVYGGSIAYRMLRG